MSAESDACRCRTEADDHQQRTAEDYEHRGDAKLTYEPDPESSDGHDVGDGEEHGDRTDSEHDHRRELDREEPANEP